MDFKDAILKVSSQMNTNFDPQLKALQESEGMVPSQFSTNKEAKNKFTEQLGKAYPSKPIIEAQGGFLAEKLNDIASGRRALKQGIHTKAARYPNIYADMSEYIKTPDLDGFSEAGPYYSPYQKVKEQSLINRFVKNKIPALSALLGGASFLANPTVSQAAEIGAGFTPANPIAEWFNPRQVNELNDVQKIKDWK
jgi:hypothetical protein